MCIFAHLFCLFKQIADLFAEAFLFCHIGAVAAVVKLTKQFFLVLGKIGGDLYLHGEIQISAAIGTNDGNTLALKGELSSRLGAFGNLKTFFAFQGGNGNFCAKSRFCKGNGYFAVNIAAVAFKDGVRTDIDLNNEVAVHTAALACITLVSQKDSFPFIDTCGNGGVEFLSLSLCAGSPAVLARLLDDLARATAHVTGTGALHHTQHGTLLEADLSRAVALGTGFRLRARFCSRAGTFGTGFRTGEFNGLLTAERRFFKGNDNAGEDIVSVYGAVSARGGSAAAEEAGENISHIKIHTAESAETAKASLSCSVIGIHPCMTELVVAAFLFPVGENGIGFVDFLKLSFRFFITGIFIGVVFLGKLAVCFFDIAFACAFTQPEYFVKISFVFAQKEYTPNS